MGCLRMARVRVRGMHYIYYFLWFYKCENLLLLLLWGCDCMQHGSPLPKPKLYKPGENLMLLIANYKRLAKLTVYTTISMG